MPIKVIVFDFDGTLVDSNRLKYDAFFELFPGDEHHVLTIRNVLTEMNEQSRFVIIEEILARLGFRKGGGLEHKAGELADAYNEIALTGAKTCPEIPGATATLASLSGRYRLYLSSTTPDSSLKEIVRFRKWNTFFQGVFGYPHQKSATVRHIMKRETVTPDEVLVVGDGDSDRESAGGNRCFFIHANADFNLRNLEEKMKDL